MIIQTDTITLNDTINVFVIENQVTFSEYFKEPNTIIAITAILVSIIGLIVSVLYNRKTANHTKLHDKLSIEPMLSFMHKVSDSEEIENLELMNNGLGPAKITSIKYIYDYNDYKFIYALYKSHFPNIYKKLEKDKSMNVDVDGDYVISTNENLIVFNYKFIDASEFNNLRTLLSKVVISVDYETVYKEKRQLISKIRKQQ